MIPTGSQVTCISVFRNFTHSAPEHDPPSFGTSPTANICSVTVSNALEETKTLLTHGLTPNKHQHLEDISVDNLQSMKVSDNRTLTAFSTHHPPNHGTLPTPVRNFTHCRILFCKCFQWSGCQIEAANTLINTV